MSRKSVKIPLLSSSYLRTNFFLPIHSHGRHTRIEGKTPRVNLNVVLPLALPRSKTQCSDCVRVCVIYVRGNYFIVNETPPARNMSSFIAHTFALPSGTSTRKLSSEKNR